MTLLRELIHIPEYVQKGDFVLRLSEGVTDPAGTLNDYVVTPELARCFDDALALVREAVARRTSKARLLLHGPILRSSTMAAGPKCASRSARASDGDR